MQANLFEEGKPETGDEHDFWITPPSAVEKVLPLLPRRRKKWKLIDPGTGTGALPLHAFEAGLRFDQVEAIELQPLWEEAREKLKRLERSGVRVKCYQGDWFDSKIPPGTYGGADTLVLMNPPYSKPRKTIGLEFVEKAIEVASPRGCVAALLQLGFAETPKRAMRVHRKHPSTLGVFEVRPDFGGEYGSGQRPFAWFVWDLFKPSSRWLTI